MTFNRKWVATVFPWGSAPNPGILAGIQGKRIIDE
jgi:hypothetical protein